MKDNMRFASDIAASLSLAVKATEYSESDLPMTGLAQFTANTIELRKSYDTEQTIASVEIIVDDVVEDVVVEEVVEDVVEDAVQEEVKDAVEDVVEEEVVEEVVEDAVQEEVKDAVVEDVAEDVVQDVVVEDVVVEDVVVEDVVEEVVEEETISDEEWALQEFNAGVLDVDYVEEISLEDVWESIVEPEEEEAVVPSEARKEKDQVVLVVDQLVVSPQQGTTIIGTDGQPQQPAGPVRPAAYAQPAAGPIVYQAPPVQQAPYAQPPVEQAPYAQPPVQQAPYAQPPVQQAPYAQPPVYNPPAEISVNMSAPAPAATPSAPLDNVSVPDKVSPTDGAADRVYDENSIPVYEVQEEEQIEEHIPKEVSEKLRDPDQIIEIRSDATSISANTVSVSSASTPLPGLANFDPRRYFNPNEIIAPKLEANITVNTGETAPKNPYAGDLAAPTAPAYEEPKVTSSTSDILNSIIMPEEAPIVEVLKDELAGDAASRVNQMFGELRRFRDK